MIKIMAFPVHSASSLGKSSTPGFWWKEPPPNLPLRRGRSKKAALVPSPAKGRVRVGFFDDA
jgi:hypothetical protein